MNEPATRIVPRDYHDIISKAAAVKDVDVEKLRQLMEMQEQWQARQAQTHYNEMMSRAQAEMTTVSKDSVNPITRSRYASLAALDDAIRPIYTKYGFSVEFNEEHPGEREGVLLAILVSNGAETRRRTKYIPVVTAGIRGREAMTATHASVAAVTYGRRALLKMVFNIAEDDDDGNHAAGRGRVEVPDDVRKEFDAIEDDTKRADYLIKGMREQKSHSDLYVYGEKRRPLFLRLAKAERDRVDAVYKELIRIFADQQDAAEGGQ